MQQSAILLSAWDGEEIIERLILSCDIQLISDNVFHQKIRQLKEVQKQGKVKNIGLLNPTAKQLRQSFMIEPYDIVVDFVQTQYSFFNRVIECNDIWDICHRLGLTIETDLTITELLLNEKLSSLVESELENTSPTDLQNKLCELFETDSHSAFVKEYFDRKYIKNNIRLIQYFLQEANLLAIEPMLLMVAWIDYQNVALVSERYSEDMSVHSNLLKNMSQKFPPGFFRGHSENYNMEQLIHKLDPTVNLERDIDMGKLRGFAVNLLLCDKLSKQQLQKLAEQNLCSKFSQKITKGKLPMQMDSPLSISIADQQNTVLAVSVGTTHTGENVPVTPDTAYNVGSISKFIIMNMTIQLVGQNKIKLFNTINQFLPELAIPHQEKITVLNLLNHTSGLIRTSCYDFKPGGDLQLLLGDMAIEPPNGQFNYANINFYLLALIIEKIHSGKKLHCLFQEMIAKPLGLTNTYHINDPHAQLKLFAEGYKFDWDSQKLILAGKFYIYGATGFRSTVKDLAKLYKHFFEDDNYMPPILRRIIIASPRYVVLKIVTRKKEVHYPAVMGLGIERLDMDNTSLYGNGGWVNSHAIFAGYWPKKKRSLVVALSKTQGLTNYNQQRQLLPKVSSLLNASAKPLGIIQSHKSSAKPTQGSEPEQSKYSLKQGN